MLYYIMVCLQLYGNNVYHIRPAAFDDLEEPDPGRGAGQGPSGKKIPRGIVL